MSADTDRLAAAQKFWRDYPESITAVAIDPDDPTTAGWVTWKDEEGAPQTIFASFQVALGALNQLIESDAQIGGSGIIETRFPAFEDLELSNDDAAAADADQISSGAFDGQT